MDVSVVIPCHNAADNISRLLDGLSKQTLDPSRYEILLVDDGSTDDSAAIASSFSRVQILHHSCTSGPGASRNFGADEACGRIILFLDSDLQVSPDLLEKHLNAHSLIPNLAAAGGSVLPLGEPGIFSWQLADHLSSWFNAHSKVKYSRPPEYLPSLNFSIDRTSVLANRNLRWASGLMHTGEDVLYCHALKVAGLRLAFIPDATVFHQDRMALRGYTMHMYRWGEHAPFVRGEIKNLQYSFLFPRQPWLQALFLPIILIGYTFLVWKSWLPTRPFQVTLMLPQLIFGRLAYIFGVMNGSIARWKEGRSGR